MAASAVVMIYGNINSERGQDNWRVRLAMARLWVKAVNDHDGDARLVHLPEIGIRGNAHFLMSESRTVGQFGGRT